MRQGMKPNIMDQMIEILEKYSNNLEEVVEQRTCQLHEEMRKVEDLLNRMLPKSVARQLTQRISVEPETFPCVTIYFSDIVGFTSLCSESTPLEVICCNVYSLSYGTFRGRLKRCSKLVKLCTYSPLHFRLSNFLTSFIRNLTVSSKALKYTRSKP